MKAVKDFLGKPAPPGYVAGLGRGAVGFTTRADLGSGRDLASEGQTTVQEAAESAARNENEEGLLGTGPYDKEDIEADAIYAAVDAKMEERRKARREAKAKEQASQSASDKPKIAEQFGDLKRDLSQLSANDWMNIPEPGDMRSAGSGGRKRVKESSSNSREFYSATSDRLLDSARAQQSLVGAIDAQVGLSSSLTSGSQTPMADYRQISRARDDLLRVKLDQASGTDSTSGKTTVDPKGYLSGLNSVIVKSDTEIGDIKRAKELLRSVVSTNPKHAPGWIAAARVDEIDGKLGAARAKMAKACEECPGNEDVWLEAARINTDDNAKVIFARAVESIPHSVKIWMAAFNLESDVKRKRRVIRKALEAVTNSVVLWRAAVDLEDELEDARLLLARAVECIPESSELWLALARLETYEQAKKVLNKARKANPTSHLIWVAAAQLEESAGKADNVDMLINKAVKALTAKGANLTREAWIEEAEKCEKSESVLTCQAIVRATIGFDVDEEDRFEKWSADADSSISRGAIETARAIFAELIKAFPDDVAVWINAVNMEKKHGDEESHDEVLQRATKVMPESEVFWLMRAKEKWIRGDLETARQILADAFLANPDNEEIWLAAVKIEVEDGSFEKGRLLLQKAREKAGTERVWLKSAVLERNLKQISIALDLVDQGLRNYPKFHKLWLVKGQMLCKDTGDIDRARETYSEGIKNCPESIPLWIESSRLEVGKNPTRARAILDRARVKNPKNDVLWLESLQLEKRLGNDGVAKSTLSKALQECPGSGLLWSEAIFMEPRPSRKSRSVDALKKCNDHPAVVTSVGRLFWHDRNIEKARSWLNRSIKINPDVGDSWMWLYKFEVDHGTDETREDVMKRFIVAEPKHGILWTATSKMPENFRVGLRDMLLQAVSRL